MVQEFHEKVKTLAKSPERRDASVKKPSPDGTIQQPTAITFVERPVSF
jgi:hypothetical protein